MKSGGAQAEPEGSSDLSSQGKVESPSIATAEGAPRHIPYVIDAVKDRFAFYENYWKRVALQLLLRHDRPKSQTVLDFGCGRGEALEIFGAAGYRVKGTDTDPECVRLASRLGSACLLNAANPVEQFGPKSFDLVICFHVLEHVEAPRKVLRDLARIARRYVLVAVPNLRYLHRLFARQVSLDYVNEGHLQSWDHWHLRNLAERHCGLELVEWASDATLLPGLSQLVAKLLGQRAAIALETGVFRRLFPFHCASVIGLFAVQEAAPGLPEIAP